MALQMIHAGIFRSTSTELDVFWSTNHVHRDNDVALIRAKWAEVAEGDTCPIMQFDSFVPFGASEDEIQRIIMEGARIAMNKMRMAQFLDQLADALLG